MPTRALNLIQSLLQRWLTPTPPEDTAAPTGAAPPKAADRSPESAGPPPVRPPSLAEIVNTPSWNWTKTSQYLVLQILPGLLHGLVAVVLLTGGMFFAWWAGIDPVLGVAGPLSGYLAVFLAGRRR